MKIQALHLSCFIEYAYLRGIPRDHWLPMIKMPAENLLNPDAFIDSATFFAVAGQLDRLFPDQLLGIKMGNHMNLKSLGLIYQISLQATTVEEALFYLKNYLSHTLPIVDLHTKVTATEAVISISFAHPQMQGFSFIVEQIMTVICKELKLMGGERLKVILQSPLRNNAYPEDWQKGNSFTLRFKNFILKSNLQDKTKWCLNLLVPEYLKMIEKLNSDGSFTAKVKISTLNLCSPMMPGLAAVADSLHLTPRSLQRQLETEHTTFRKIQEDLKKQISYLLLNHGRFSIADIASILGYSETAAFNHSFKRWHGNSPLEVRRLHRSA